MTYSNKKMLTEAISIAIGMSKWFNETSTGCRVRARGSTRIAAPRPPMLARYGAFSLRVQGMIGGSGYGSGKSSGVWFRGNLYKHRRPPLAPLTLTVTLAPLTVLPKTQRQVKRGRRCRANMAHMRQSRPDSGLGFQVKVLQTFKVVP